MARQRSLSGTGWRATLSEEISDQLRDPFRLFQMHGLQPGRRQSRALAGESGGDCVKQRRHLASDERQAANDHDGNTAGDQAVLNRSGSRNIARELSGHINIFLRHCPHTPLHGLGRDFRQLERKNQPVKRSAPRCAINPARSGARETATCVRSIAQYGDPLRAVVRYGGDGVVQQWRLSVLRILLIAAFLTGLGACQSIEVVSKSADEISFLSLRSAPSGLLAQDHCTRYGRNAIFIGNIKTKEWTEEIHQYRCQ